MQQPPQQPSNYQGRSGIIFGPGRTTRLPEPNTPEYQEMIKRLRTIVPQQ